MRVILLGLLALTSATTALAQTRPTAAVAAPAARSRCDILASDWRRIEQNLADRVAEGVADNSAPRATLREMQEANDLAIAAMTLQFMRDNRCTMPTRAPNGAGYIGAALACRTAQLRATGSQTPAECNRETWTRAD
jgi:hypothetical protein